MSGNNVNDYLRLCTAGSKLDNMTGYGLVLLDPEDITLGEDSGGLGANPTVFQAECMTIVRGLEQHSNAINGDLQKQAPNLHPPDQNHSSRSPTACYGRP